MLLQQSEKDDPENDTCPDQRMEPITSAKAHTMDRMPLLLARRNGNSQSVELLLKLTQTNSNS